MNMQTWTAPMWQAFVGAQWPLEKRRWIVEHLVPVLYRESVINHCRTVVGLREKRKKNATHTL